jgi:serine/threonine-protein kinase
MSRRESGEAKDIHNIVGQKIGHIVVLSIIRAGGIGAVYLGYDSTLQRQVAVKVLHSRYRLQQGARVRFMHEARVLSQLAHPNICSVFDYIKGEECDFLIMELIKGKSLHHTIAAGLSQSQKLSIAKQLLDVLVAVHSRGVIHRDLTPDNIMVTPEGAVKVLDFGLARAVDTAPVVVPDTGPGEPVAQSGADEEASWTRLTMDDLGSAGLQTKAGVVVGTVRYMSPEQARGEPVTPASDIFSLGLILQQLFTGACPYDRNMSTGQMLYARANEGGVLPTTGLRPDHDRLISRMKAFAPGMRPSSVDAAANLQLIIDRPKRRRRTAMFVTAWMVLLLFATTVTVQSWRAARAAERANREAKTAQAVSEFLVELFEVNDPYAAGPGEPQGRDVPTGEILDRGAQRLRSEFQDQPEIRARLMRIVGVVYSNLGSYDTAQPLIEEALQVQRDRLADDESELAKSLVALGKLLRDRGNQEEAQPLLEEALILRQRLWGDEHLEVAESLNELARLYESQSQLDEAESHFREALAMQQRLLGEEHAAIAEGLNNLGSLLRRTGEFEEAESLLLKALAMWRSLVGDEHLRVATTMNNLGVVYLNRGDHAAAKEMIAESVRQRRKLLNRNHPQVAQALNNLAKLHADENDVEAAAALYRESLSISRQLDDPIQPFTLNNLAGLLQRSGAYQEAAPLLQESLVLFQRFYGESHVYVGISLSNQANLKNVMGKHAEAEALAHQSLSVLSENLAADHWRIADAESILGASFTGRGRFAEAETLLLKSYPILRDKNGLHSLYCRRAVQHLVDLYQASGRPEQAAEYQKLLDAATP